jgi:hypothetical protein
MFVNINPMQFASMAYDDRVQALVGEVILSIGKGNLPVVIRAMNDLIDNHAYTQGLEFGERTTRDVMKAEWRAKMNDRKVKLISKTVVKHGTAKKAKTGRTTAKSSKKSKRKSYCSWL